MNSYMKDALWRVLWTLAQTGVAAAITWASGIPTWWAVAIAAALAAIKTWLGTVIVNPFTSLSWAVLERVAFTALEAALSTITVSQLGLPVAYIPIGSMALAAIKSWVAGFVGSPATAALLPPHKDPEAPGVDFVHVAKPGMPAQR